MAETETKHPEKLDTAPTTITETDNTSQDAQEQLTPAEQEPANKDQDDTKTESATTKETETKAPSEKVQQAMKYNNRDRNRNNDRPYYKRDYRKNVKSDLTSQAESSDPVEIRKQVEFYFSDSNLLNDKFLFLKVDGPTNLPVPISVIHSFKRMRHFQPLSAVIAALKDSSTLDVVEVDEETCVQRKVPLSSDLKDMPLVDIQKVHEDAAMARSVYAKGFGDEEPGTQFDIEAFFAEFGSTNSVRLRRTPEKTFKGSVFVEFDTDETQKKFLSLDPQPKWRGKDLLIKSKKQYCDDKVDDIAAGRIRRKETSPFEPRGGHKNNDKDWRVRRDEDRAGGFKDRNQRHKGFGSAGRGRGGRGGRSGRGGHRGGRYDRDHDRDAKKEKKDEHNTSAPSVQASTPSSPHSPQPATKDKSPPPSKKRAREDEGEAEAGPEAKKVDLKAGAEDA